jgi:hypothetical protein
VAAPSPAAKVLWSPTGTPLTVAPTWVDITSRMRAVSTSRGRDSELDQVKTGEATVVVSNTDRAFDPTYAAGPYYGALGEGHPVMVATGHLGVTLASNPTAYLPLDEDWAIGPQDRRSTTLATVNGGTNYTRGVTGPLPGTRALWLNPTGGSPATYVRQANVAAQSAHPNTFNFECWVNIDGTQLVNCIASNGWTNNWALTVDWTGVVKLFNVSSLATIFVTAAGAYAGIWQNGSTWVHLLFTKNGTGANACSLYLNGVPVTLTTNAAATLASSTSPLYIGAHQGDNNATPTMTNFLGGKIAQVALWDNVWMDWATMLPHYQDRTSPSAAVFTGFTTSFPQSFPGPDAVASIKAVDATAVLADRSYFETTGPAYTAAVMADTPWGWWRMRETQWPTGAGSMTTADSSGNGRHGRHNSSKIAIGGAPLTTDSPSVEYPRADDAGTYSEVVVTVSRDMPTPALSMECWVQFDERPRRLNTNWFASDPLIFHLARPIADTTATDYGIALQFGVRPDDPSNLSNQECNSLWAYFSDDPNDSSQSQIGVAWAVSQPKYVNQQTAASIPLFDGRPHHLVLTTTSTFPAAWTDVSLYIDGAFAGAWVLQNVTRELRGHAGDLWTCRWGERLGGRMAEVAVYDSQLSANQVAAHFNAAAKVYRRNETAGARITATLDNTGWPTHLRDVHPGSTIVAPLVLTSTRVGDLLDVTARTDGGLLYVDALGRVRFLDRRSFATYGPLSTSQATFSDNRADVSGSTVHLYVREGFTYNTTDSLLRNIVTVEATDSSIDAYTATNATSITNHGIAAEQTTLRPAYRGDMVGYAETKVANYAEPVVRFEALTVVEDDRSSTTRAAGWGNLLGLDLGHKVTVKRTPKVGAVVSVVTRVERIEREITPQVWATRIAVAARDTTQNVWLIGSGVLGSSTTVSW